MATLKRPEPPFLLSVQTTDSQIIILSHGIHSIKGVNGITREVLAALLITIQDLATNSSVIEISDSLNGMCETRGIRIILDKVYHHDYYNRFLFALGREFDEVLKRLIDQARQLQQETKEEVDDQAYMAGLRVINDEFINALKGLVEQHKLKAV